MSITEASKYHKPSIKESFEKLKESVNSIGFQKYSDEYCHLTYETARSISFCKNKKEFRLILFGNFDSPLYFNTNGDVTKVINVMLKLLSI